MVGLLFWFKVKISCKIDKCVPVFKAFSVGDPLTPTWGGGALPLNPYYRRAPVSWSDESNKLDPNPYTRRAFWRVALFKCGQIVVACFFFKDDRRQRNNEPKLEQWPSASPFPPPPPPPPPRPHHQPKSQQQHQQQQQLRHNLLKTVPDTTSASGVNEFLYSVDRILDDQMRRHVELDRREQIRADWQHLAVVVDRVLLVVFVLTTVLVTVALLLHAPYSVDFFLGYKPNTAMTGDSGNASAAG